MNRRSFLKAIPLSIGGIVTTPALSKPVEDLPPLKIAKGLKKIQWHAIPKWSQMDKRYYYELRDDPKRPLSTIEKLDQLVPISEVKLLKRHGYTVRVYEPSQAEISKVRGRHG